MICNFTPVYITNENLHICSPKYMYENISNNINNSVNLKTVSMFFDICVNKKIESYKDNGMNKLSLCAKTWRISQAWCLPEAGARECTVYSSTYEAQKVAKLIHCIRSQDNGHLNGVNEWKRRWEGFP